jgi:hypothetical protein
LDESDSSIYFRTGITATKTKRPRVIRRLRVLLKKINGVNLNSKRKEQHPLYDKNEHLKNRRQSTRNRYEKGQASKRVPSRIYALK